MAIVISISMDIKKVNAVTKARAVPMARERTRAKAILMAKGKSRRLV
jgi:hypothetical protein